jgi:inorganic pyrophosphatase
MLDFRTLRLHPGFPDQVWVVVEQPAHEPFRLAYDPAQGTFVRTAVRSLTHARGFSGAYGWIGGLGMPPGPHFDVLLVTPTPWEAGAVVSAFLFGVFYRRDGDHKLIALDAALRPPVLAPDLAALRPADQAQLYHLYPDVGPGEGWYGGDEARTYLRRCAARLGYLPQAEDTSPG